MSRRPYYSNLRSLVASSSCGPRVTPHRSEVKPRITQPRPGPARVSTPLRQWRATRLPTRRPRRSPAADLAPGDGGARTGSRRDRRLPVPPLHPQSDPRSAKDPRADRPDLGDLGHDHRRVGPRAEVGADRARVHPGSRRPPDVGTTQRLGALIREAFAIDREVFRDFFRKLDAPRAQPESGRT
jgi:hypothetical protein